jgi:predicted CoA-substrate-specific enzyme activase
MSSAKQNIKVGIDIGSKTLKAAILKNNKVEETFTFDHKGNLAGTLANVLGIIEKNYTNFEEITYGLCGNIEIETIETIDSILASVEANRFLATGCRNIIGIGCESFYLIILDEKGNYKEHSVNPMCASGTGSFLDQQAERIGLTIEELSEKAFAFKGKMPSIATRCAVFAKSDIIHAQAEGFGRDAIAAGLCKGMARSILSQLKKGRELDGGIVLTGGVSRNRMIASQRADQLVGQLKSIGKSAVFNAIGAAILGKESRLNPDELVSAMKKKHQRRKPLEITLTDYPDFKKNNMYILEDVEITEYENLKGGTRDILIGIDIGSTSTKAVVLDYYSDAILAGLYTRTAGAPVEATKKILKHIGVLFQQSQLVIRGVGTTGSGRTLVKEIINGDLVVNEITAHARGALFLDPEVDTIIEIGGQDSKFTQLENGQVVNAAMNYVCAAGTGSFIEEQATRLDISLDDITDLAMGQEAPYTSDRCTVYMERDLNLFQVEGFNKKEIITAVLFSVRDNYLSKVVGKLPLGKRIFFQGATARNKALVAAFEQQIKKPISVSLYCHLTGALGTAVLLKEKKLDKSDFAGLNFEYTTGQEICGLCHNQCDLSLYHVGERTTAWGLKCGRDYEDKKYVGKKKISDLELSFKRTFAETKEYEKEKSVTVGLVKGLYQAEFYPLFVDFFKSLGCEVIIEDSNSLTLSQGNKLVNSDFCAPIVMMHGMVDRLLNKGVDFIFLPALVNEKSLLDKQYNEKIYRDKTRDSYYCYYSSYAPSIILNVLDDEHREKIIAPNLYFDDFSPDELASIVASSIENLVNEDVQTISSYFTESLEDFRKNQKLWKELGQDVLTSREDKMKIMLLGRPYSIFDGQLNLGIPAKLEELGFELLYQSMINLDESFSQVTARFLTKMHWYYGQEILAAAETAAKSDNIYPVFLSCFRCSPDSYLLTYVKEIFKAYNKPYLVIQLDEHTSDVGYQTRIEAAVDTFRSHFKKTKHLFSEAPASDTSLPFSEGDIILVPFVSDIVSPLQAEAFSANGFKSAVVPLEQGMINRGYRYASGGECMPNVAIIGSVMEYIERERLDPSSCTVYLPGLCMSCNFNQYAVLFDNACETSEFRGLKVYNGNMIQKIDNVTRELNLNIMEVGIVGSLLYKLYFRFAPYEKRAGEAKIALNQSMIIISNALHENRSLHDAAKEIRGLFEVIVLRDIPRKPRAILVGDFYAKYNNILNHNLTDEILSLGAEVIIPSFTETVNHFLHEDLMDNDGNRKFHKGFVLVEKRFELVFHGLLEEEIFEPPMEICTSLADRYSYDRALAGETAISLGRVLYMLEKRQVEAIVHINPVFCCPGVVSSSIFQRIKDDYNVPVIDLFYDGNNKPNDLLKPQLYYLCNNK